MNAINPCPCPCCGHVPYRKITDASELVVGEWYWSGNLIVLASIMEWEDALGRVYHILKLSVGDDCVHAYQPHNYAKIAEHDVYGPVPRPEVVA